MNPFYNVNIVVRCPLAFKERLKTLAEAQGLSLSKFVRNACADAVKKADQ